MTVAKRKNKAIPLENKEEEPALNVESVTYGELTWVNIMRPTVREMEYLAKNYPFHPLDLDDCLSLKQRPKLDVYPDYLFFIFHFSVYNPATRVSTYEQVSAFIGDKYLITLHSGQLKPLVNFFRRCQLEEAARQENFNGGPGFLFYRILDRAVDAYFPVLDKILGQISDIEDTVFDEFVESSKEVAILRRDIITQRRIMFPDRTVIAELEPKLKRFTTVDITVYFGDLMDHLNRICDGLEECKEIIEVYKDSDYVLGTERLNRVIRVLTIMSSVLLPFLIVSSFYGMNIPLPGGVEKGSLKSFFLLLAGMAVISGGMLYYFRHKRWI